MRVAGLDVGTVSIDACVLEDGRAGMHRSWDTAALLARPSDVLALCADMAYVGLGAGYGAPLVTLADADAAALTLALLPDVRAGGGIGGLRRLLAALGALPMPTVLLPGVVHLPSVPRYRKLNRIDLGTADKVAVAALALALHGTSLDAIIVELGGAFTAAIALAGGQIVDAVGGSAGPMGQQASGCLDGEVAVLAGQVTKAMLFRGGRADAVALIGEDAARLAWLEGAAKAVMQCAVTTPGATLVLLSGRGAQEPGVRDALAAMLPSHTVSWLGSLPGLEAVKAGAQGAALIADGLAGGRHAALVERMRLREAHGSVLDHLVVLAPDAARRTLGLA